MATRPRSSSGQTGLDADNATVVRLANDRQLTYTTYGAPDGRPVVFLHGTPGSRRLGELFDSAGRAHDIRVLAPDRPGYGASSAWPDREITDAGQFVTAVLDDAGEQTAGLVAFSGGGPYALATATAQSDRLTRVDVVSGATPSDVSEATPAMQQLLTGLAKRAPTVLGWLFSGQAWVADRLDPSFVLSQYTANDSQSIPDDDAAIVKADFLEAFANGADGAVTEFQHTATDWGISYPSIAVDVCFWHGAADTNVPIESVRQLTRRVPPAHLETLDNADHLGTLLERIPEIVRSQAKSAHSLPK